MLDGFAIFVLLVAFMYDAFLILSGKPTISQWYHRLFATKVDLILYIACVIALLVLPLNAIPKVLLATVAGHVFWPNKELHK